MLQSRAGSTVTHFPNNNRACEGWSLIHIYHSSANGGKQVAIISPSCIGNWWRQATHSHIGLCISSLLVICRKGERILKLLFSFHALLCLHDTLFSFFFAVLPKNSHRKNKKRWLCFGLCTDVGGSGLRVGSAVRSHVAHTHRRTA